MTVKTVVINESGTTLKLKEGNGGVYRNLATLQAKTGKHTITCNNNATYREYWVGTGLEDGDESVITITSDDCSEYQTIYIINDLANPAKLALRPVNRGVKETAVVNQTGGDVKLIKNGGAEKIVLKKDGKFLVKSAPGEAKDCNYEVEAGGKLIKISTDELAKAQRINISEVDSTPGRAKLDMVSRRLYLTEVKNKTGIAVKVMYRKGDHAGEEVKTLQTDETFTIEYDPGKKGRNYWVECPTDRTLPIASTDFTEFGRIEIVAKSESGGTELDLEKLDPRPSTGPSKNGILSKVGRFLGW
jgi:hypothetical protein